MIVENHGTIVLLTPSEPGEKEWLCDNVDPEAQWFGYSLAVEPRYVAPILEGLVGDGFEVREG